jgi:hypothetical protein
MTPQLLHDYGPTLISIVVGIVVGIYSRLGAKRAKVAVQQGDAAAVDMSHATLELGNLRAEVAELQEKVGKGRHAPAPAPVPDPIPDPVPVAPRPAPRHRCRGRTLPRRRGRSLMSAPGPCGPRSARDRGRLAGRANLAGRARILGGLHTVGAGRVRPAPFHRDSNSCRRAYRSASAVVSQSSQTPQVQDQVAKSLPQPSRITSTMVTWFTGRARGSAGRRP